MNVEVLGTGAYYERGIAYLKEYGYTISKRAEVLVCLAHPEILRRETLDRYAKGCINFHCGLPDFRGRHPLQWMLIEGIERIPCAVHYMNEDIDTGDIIAESSFEVDRNETYDSALEKVLKQVGPLLITALYKIEHGQVVRKPQGIGRYWPKRAPADSEFTFDMPSKRVHRFINAMSGTMPHATCEGRKYQLSHVGSRPGVTIDTSGPWEVVATQDGVVLVLPE